MDHRATFRISTLTLTLAAIGVGAERNIVAIFYSVRIGRAAD